MRRRKPILLRCRKFIPKGHWFHVGGRQYQHTSTIPVHTHDFSEVFWIAQGQGVHQINGQRKRLNVGDLILVRQEDCHAFFGKRGIGMTLINIAFQTSTLDDLLARYFDNTANPWQGDELPARYELPVDAIGMLSKRASVLADSPQRRIEIDSFLLELFRLLDPDAPMGRLADDHSSFASLPGWLRDALVTFRDPDYLPGGLQTLSELADRSPEHVSRLVRKHTGRTATQIINELRLEFAARQLRLTSEPIANIAADCGLENLGHFYKVFREHFNMTPRKYRLAEQAIVGATA